jgi:hypothetical protein
VREDELVDRKRSCVPRIGRLTAEAALPAHTLECAMAVALFPVRIMLSPTTIRPEAALFPADCSLRRDKKGPPA